MGKKAKQFPGKQGGVHSGKGVKKPTVVSKGGGGKKRGY